MGNFLSFQEMIAPKIIEGFFALATAGCILLGVLMAFQDNDNSLLYGVIVAAGGPVITRIYCEFLIVVFRIYETLNDVSDQLENVLEALVEDDSRIAA